MEGFESRKGVDFLEVLNWDSLQSLSSPLRETKRRRISTVSPREDRSQKERRIDD